MTMKIKGAKELANMMKLVEKNAPGRIEKKLNEIATEVKENTQKKTPEKTGELKKQFKIKRAKKSGSSYKSQVYNNSPISHLIEDGHWLVVNRGPNKYKKIKWVDGFSMLSSSVEEKNEKVQKELEEWLPTVYKELEK